MNEKETNAVIYQKVLTAAHETFNAGTINAGTYTLAQLDCRNSGFQYADEDKEYNITVDAFSCRFTSRSAFELARKFARLAGVKPPTFTKEAANNSEPVCTFTMNVPKTVKGLAAFVAGKDDNRVALENILLDIERGKLVASNGKVLKAVNVGISDLQGTAAYVETVGGINRNVCYISAEGIKQIKGVCRVSVYQKDQTVTTEITTANGVKYVCMNVEAAPAYPRYALIYPRVSKRGFIKFAEPKAVAKWLHKKEAEPVLMEISEGGNVATFTRFAWEYSDEPGAAVQTVNFALAENNAPAFAIQFAEYSLRKVCADGWDGGLWLTGSKNAAIFDCADSEVTLCMPCLNKNLPSFGEIENRETPCTERNAGTAAAGISENVEIPTETKQVTEITTNNNTTMETTKNAIVNVTANKVETQTERHELPAPPSVIYLDVDEMEKAQTAQAAATDETPKRKRKGIKTVSGHPLRGDYSFFEIEALKYFAEFGDNPNYNVVNEAPNGDKWFTFGKSCETFDILCDDGKRITLRRYKKAKVLDVYRTTPKETLATSFVSDETPTQTRWAGVKQIFRKIGKAMRYAAAILPTCAGVIFHGLK